MSLSSKFFSDGAHADMYLKGCVARLEDKLVYIKASNATKVVYQECDDIDPYNKERMMPASKEAKLSDLDLSPIPLGMINLIGNANSPKTQYVVRKPERVYKVGLSTKNITAYPIKDNGWLAPIGYVFPTKYLAAAVRGEYPGYEEAYAKAMVSRSVSRTVAFSRRFCLMSGGKIFYKFHGEPVGLAKRNGVQLFDQYAYLQQVLEEDMR